MNWKNANLKAQEFGVNELCEFVTGDINVSVTEDSGYDIAILGAIGDVLGCPEEAINKVANTVKPHGYIIIEDAYTRDDVTNQLKCISYNYPSYSEWNESFSKTNVRLIEAKSVNDDDMAELNEQNTKAIIIRANELKMLHPEKSQLFNAYVKSQQDESDDLKDAIVGTTWFLQKCF